MVIMALACLYCAAPSGSVRGWVTGFDRACSRDSEGCHTAYDEDNTFHCCHRCNKLKGCLDPRTFVECCIHIATLWRGCQYRGRRGYYRSAWMPSKFASFKQYWRSAYSRGLRFELRERHYRAITARPCTYCRRKGCSGIDRRDNTKGYVLVNVDPCWGECNLMKGRLSQKDFIDLVFAVAANEAEIIKAVEALPMHLQVRCRKMKVAAKKR